MLRPEYVFIPYGIIYFLFVFGSISGIHYKRALQTPYLGDLESFKDILTYMVNGFASPMYFLCLLVKLHFATLSTVVKYLWGKIHL